MDSVRQSHPKVNGKLKTFPQVARVIEALQAHARRCPCRPMSREELVRAAWGAEYLTTDCRANLDTHIHLARRALGDDARAPRYIQTERGAGYWWVGPVGAEEVAP